MNIKLRTSVGGFSNFDTVMVLSYKDLITGNITTKNMVYGRGNELKVLLLDDLEMLCPIMYYLNVTTINVKRMVLNYATGNDYFSTEVREKRLIELVGCDSDSVVLDSIRLYKVNTVGYTDITLCVLEDCDQVWRYHDWLSIRTVA